MLKVTSLELSKKLKIAGFPQATHFRWAEVYFQTRLICLYDDSHQPIAVAPTLEEVLDQMPKGVQLTKESDGYIVGYPITENEATTWHRRLGESGAEAAGKLYLFLARRNLMDVNQN